MGAPGIGRLRKGAEFDSVYSKGTVFNGPLFVVRVLENDAGVERWGFAVGKRLLPKATDRNRLRRRLREAARGAEGSRAAGPGIGIDVVVTAKAGALNASLLELRSALATVLGRARAAVQ